MRLSGIIAGLVLLGCQPSAAVPPIVDVSSSPTAQSTAIPSVRPANTPVDQWQRAAIERGRILFFSQGCNVCHGEQGEGDIGPALASTSLTFAEVRRQLRNPRGFMPAYIEEILSDEQIRDLYAFEQSLAKP